MSKQEQKSGDGSANIQVAGDVVVGLSVNEVRQLALDVFKANFYDLGGVGKQIVVTRVEEITDAFLKKLQKENPAGLLKAQDPGFQSDLFTVQKEHAKNGDKDLGDLLVDLLVDRSKTVQRDILQIVLSESLSTAPKLTNEQLAALAIIFLFKYTQRHYIRNNDFLGEDFDKHVHPFVEKLSKNRACYQHLQFAGCGSVEISTTSLESCLLQGYQGLFSKGFEESIISQQGFTANSSILVGELFIKCINDPSKVQVNALSKEVLEQIMIKHAIIGDDKVKFLKLFDRNKMSEAEVREKCVAIRPYMSTVFEVWSSSPMQSFSLTSVGMALGHANIKRLIGEFADLRIWIK